MKQALFKKFNSIDVIATMLFTLIAIYKNSVTVFYILYLFWWNELLFNIITYFFKSTSTNLENKPKRPKFTLMVIYWFFIVLFFGFIANFKNTDSIIINLEVLTFQNVYFNINILFIIIELIILYKCNPKVVDSVELNLFSYRAIILHISIILGAFIMLGLVPQFPTFFTPENNLASVLVITPFLILKAIFQRMKLI